MRSGSGLGVLGQRVRLAVQAVLDRLVPRALVRRPESPIVVLGNQKSGTTAIAGLLARACGLSCTLDIRSLWGREIDPADARSFLAAMLREHPLPFARRVIKEPQLTFLAGALAELLPGARFAFVVRDPRDNVRSILDHLGIPGDVEPGGVDAAALSPAWRTVVTGCAPPAPPLDVVSGLAHRWVEAVRQLRGLREAGHRVEVVRYEDFCAAKEDTIAALARALGERPIRPLGGATERQFQPRGLHRDASWREFYSPANYERILTICGPSLESYGYAEGAREP